MKLKILVTIFEIHTSHGSIGDIIKISMAFSEKTFQSRFVQKFERIVRLIDTPQHTIQGFAVDFSCNNTDKIFHHEDHGIIFKDNNFWLFIDDYLNRDNYESRVSFEFNQFMMGISRAYPNRISDSV